MGIKLKKRQSTDVVGKEPTFNVTFEGDYKGLDCSLTLKGETERDIYNKIPLVPEKYLELSITDPQSTLDEFQEPEVVEAEIVSAPPTLDADFEELPEGPSPLMLEAGENPALARFPEETDEEYEQRMQLFQDLEFRAERRKRAEAQA